MDEVILHTRAFRLRRFWNWFPMGLTYALLYMGRYNLTVAKNALGDLMTKEDFGIIFGAGTIVYAMAFLLNGPLVDRFGGRRGILAAAGGAACANFAMGGYLAHIFQSGDPTQAPLRIVFATLYSINMYFQSFGAVSIVKVNAHWFHVRERGGFSGIFGTMIASGIFLAFTVNGWLLDYANQVFKHAPSQWVVFVMPGALLALFLGIEFFLLRDRPSLAGHKDFNTGDASSDDTSDIPLPTLEIYKRIFTHPIILTVAAIEFCTGVLRNGVMHWFPIYAKEVWALPKEHILVHGSWQHTWLIALCFAVAIISAVIGSKRKGPSKGYLFVFAALAFLAPFFQAGWGGLLFIAGVIGGNVAGWISDLFFQSRRAPAAGGLYGVLIVASIAMFFCLGKPGNEIASASAHSGLMPGDHLLELGGVKIEGWADVRHAVACWPPECIGSTWDEENCVCTTRGSNSEDKRLSHRAGDAKTDRGTSNHTGAAFSESSNNSSGKSNLSSASPVIHQQGIPMILVRQGKRMQTFLIDPLPKQRAGDKRTLKARPVLPLRPLWLGIIVFIMSLCVIGTHGLLSGTATMDFGGRKGAGTAVGVIDGFVYLGTAAQSISLGFLTSRNWSYWPIFLLPFGIIGFVLLLKIWNAKPKKSAGH